MDDSGRTVASGEIGELWVRGALVIKGYINRPEATAESITDGWLHTGDIARIDEDGFVFIVDRKKDMVLRGGENVYCAEVEAAMHRHPAVAECCVFGVPDVRLGEEVASRRCAAIRAMHYRQWRCASTARATSPNTKFRIISRSANEPLPRNASGKFLKRQLRDTLWLE